MKKVMMVIFLIVAVLYAGIGCDDKKESTYTLEGTVRNVLNTPLDGRVIECTNDYEDIRLTPTTLRYTITGGSFTFSGLKEGNYILRLVPLSLDTFNGKPVYSKYEKSIGMGRDELLNVVLTADNATAVNISGTVRKGGSPFANAIVRFTVAPDTNWANAVATIRTNSTGLFAFTGIPRVYVSGTNQNHYYLNCRVDSGVAYQRVRFDSIYCDTTKSLGIIDLMPSP